MERPRCIVSVDVEEWADALVSGIPRRARQWLGQRIDPALDRVLELLDRHRASATFFVHAHLARRRPDIVRRLAEAHEIACRGDCGGRGRMPSPETLAEEIGEERALIEAVAGRTVRGHRRRGRATRSATADSLELLARAGFLYDASCGAGDGGEAAGDQPLWRFPPTPFRVPGLPVEFAGRTGLRLLSKRFLSAALDRERREGRVPHLVLHPWCLDGSGGRVPAPVARGVASAVERKICAILSTWRGIPVGEVWQEAASRHAAPSDRQGEPAGSSTAESAREYAMTSSAARR